MSRCLRRFTLALLASLLGAVAGGAEGFQEDCTNATLGGSSTLPQSNIALAGGDADFTMPACPLEETAMSDVVMCFRPQNNCTVTFSCSAAGGTRVLATVHAFQTCSTTFANCILGFSSAVPPVPSVHSLGLSAGVDYCFTCQNTVPNGSFTVSVLGTCGALPVELQEFEVSSTPLPPIVDGAHRARIR